jgi:hypothetical protein
MALILLCFCWILAKIKVTSATLSSPTPVTKPPAEDEPGAIELRFSLSGRESGSRTVGRIRGEKPNDKLIVW